MFERKTEIMKNNENHADDNGREQTDVPLSQPKQQDKQKKDKDVKKKKKRNTWPLKAMAITFALSFAVNAGSELVLDGAKLWVAILLTVIILALGVIFDMIGTASTSCDIEPFLAMASRKVKGAKTAVKLAKKSDVVSSVCNDIVGDICGIVSGVCAAAISASLLNDVLPQGLDATLTFFIKVFVCAIISTATITLKAAGKGYAVNKANDIVFFAAKVLSIFSKEG